MRFWYPEMGDIEIIRGLMAAKFFPKYQEDSPPKLFGILGGPEGLASLQSALGVIRQPYYRGLHAKAGTLMRSMIKNHPFIDGNKRIGLVTTIDFLLMNGHVLFASDDELVAFALEIAASEPDTPWQDIANWIDARCESVTKPTAEPKRQWDATFHRLNQMEDALALAAEALHVKLPIYPLR